ncbi:hypothetical protein [Streptomyces hainanensis]|uniref:hypothetical protein n=1 Tax=Streptomyces hainanensis TaxID=402648 RepID=UPI0014047817|nr:hypothetical protein [Streptomyces hainanensis]
MTPVVPRPEPLGPPGSVGIPFVTTWSGELPSLFSELVARPGGRGLGYCHERPGDRDEHGVLWARTEGAWGDGEPRLADQHPLRQRQAMTHMCCQICAGPASRTERGWLFLAGQRPDGARPAVRQLEAAHVMNPPVCLPCAAVAARRCPHLRPRPVAFRARWVKALGVQGVLYGPTPFGLVVDPRVEALPYTSRFVAWMHASQLVVEVRRVTLIDLQHELAHPRPASAP